MKLNRRNFIFGATVTAAAPLVRADGPAASGEIVLEGPAKEFRAGRSGIFDVWLKWGDFAGDTNARIEVEHLGGVCGYGYNQSHNPGWHFAGTYALAPDSRIIATNRTLADPKGLPEPVGMDAVKLVPTARRTIRRTAGDLISVCELNVGDTLEFRMTDGRVRTLELVACFAQPEVKRGFAITQFSFTQVYRIDGVERTLKMLVPSAEFLGRPFEIDGLEVWLGPVQDIFTDCGGFMVEKDYRFSMAGTCRPMRRAQLMVSEKGRRACPDKCCWWFPMKAWPIVPRQNYMGRDCWMGPWYEFRWPRYFSPRGNETHSGLDINMPWSTPLKTPFAVDEQYYANALTGMKNVRWRGIRRWNDEETWWIQSHHIDTPLLVPEHTPLKAGVVYARSGGALCGHFSHSHFMLRVFRYGKAADGVRTEESFWANPAVLFRQMQLDAPLPSLDSLLLVVNSKPESLDMGALELTVAGKGDIERAHRPDFVMFRVTPEEYFDVRMRIGFKGMKAAFARKDDETATGVVTRADGSSFHVVIRTARPLRYLAVPAGATYEPVYDYPDGEGGLVKVAFGATPEAAAKTLEDNADWWFDRVKNPAAFL